MFYSLYIVIVFSLFFTAVVGLVVFSFIGFNHCCNTDIEKIKTFKLFILFGIASFVLLFITLIVCLTKINLKAEVGFRQQKIDLLEDEEKIKRIVSCFDTETKETCTIKENVDESLNAGYISKRKVKEKSSSSDIAKRIIDSVMDV